MTNQIRTRLAPWRQWLQLLVLAFSVASALPAMAQNIGQNSASDKKSEKHFTVPSPGADLWKNVRNSGSGATQVSGIETGVLINPAGADWLNLRNGPVSEYTGRLLTLSLLVIVVFFLIRGRIKLDHGRSGRTVKRWSLFERGLHWYTASLFVILALTGLSILFGREYLIPLIGKDAFGAYAIVAKNVHNYLGPMFSVGVALMILLWFKHNLPTFVDMDWFFEGGGIIGRGHPSAGRMNAGEKVWFWLICTIGVATIFTGFQLDFPAFFELAREDFQQAQLLHAILACGWIAVFFGHAYIGTLGSEGSIQAMTRGKVDANWAKQHHDLWYDEVKGQETSDSKS